MLRFPPRTRFFAPASLFLGGVFACVYCTASAIAASTWNPTVLVNTEAFQTIDDSDASADVFIRFGEGIAKNLTYDRSAARFRFDDDLLVQGSFTATSTISGASLHLSNATTSGGLLFSRGKSSTIAQTAKGATGQVLLSQGTDTPVWKTPKVSMLWYIDGVLSVGLRKGAIVTMPYALSLTGIDLRVNGAPVGAALILDINENGTTVFSTRPQINDGATTEAGTQVFSDTLLAEGAEISVDIDQIGSTYAGSGLTIMLQGVRKF